MTTNNGMYRRVQTRLSSQHFFDRVTGNRIEKQYQHEEYCHDDHALQNFPFIVVPNDVTY